MGIPRRGARDSNEGPIVAALRVAGATVSQLSGDGIPDLLVGFIKQTFLFEVKLPLGPKGGSHAGGKSRPGEGGNGTLTRAQIDWWAAWRGGPPEIVRTPEEALALIGIAPEVVPVIMADKRVVDAIAKAAR